MLGRTRLAKVLWTLFVAVGPLALAQVPTPQKALVSAEAFFRSLAQARPLPEGVLLLRNPEGLPLEAIRALEGGGRVLVLFGACPRERIGYRIGGEFAVHTFAMLLHGRVLYLLSGEKPGSLELLQLAPGEALYRTLRAQLGLDRWELAKESLARCP